MSYATPPATLSYQGKPDSPQSHWTLEAMEGAGIETASVSGSGASIEGEG